MHWMNGFGLFMGVWVVAVVAGLALSLRWAFGRGPERRESAMEVLGKEYARGGIDRAEFERRSHDLRAASDSGT